MRGGANRSGSVQMQCQCGWTGYRRVYYEMREGRMAMIWLTRNPCPDCGGQVEETP